MKTIIKLSSLSFFSFFSMFICFGQDVDALIDQANKKHGEEKRSETLTLLENAPFDSELRWQDGHAVINRAKEKYEKGAYQSSINILLNAEKMHFGFCSVSSVEARTGIAHLRAKNYIELKEYQMARNNLENSKTYKNHSEIDSLYILTYQLEIGQEFLKENIDTSLKNTIVECGEMDCYIKIPLTNSVHTLRFKLNDIESLDLFNHVNYEKDTQIVIQDWKKKFLVSDYYRRIKTSK